MWFASLALNKLKKKIPSSNKYLKICFLIVLNLVLVHLGGNSLLVTVMSPYLEQHEVIDLIFFIIAGMLDLALHL